MENSRVFAENVERYDQWYEKHPDIFAAELAAIREVTPNFRHGLEIGVGTGRFATELGINSGIDPVSEMLEKASERGIETCLGVGEDLPYETDSFDLVFMSTTICFLADVDKVFAEIHRVLQNNCFIILGFIDKNSHLGMKYQKRAKSDSPFYSNANFVSPSEIISKLEHMGFKVVDTRQTLLPDDEFHFKLLSGYGKGAFVVIKAEKSQLQ